MKMTSFVTEVLSSAGKLEKEDLNVKIGKLSKHVDDIKTQVKETLDSRYLSFFPCLTETLDLASKVKSLSNEVHLLRKKIDTEIKGQLHMSTTEIQELSKQYTEMDVMLQIVTKLLRIHEFLESVSESLQKKEYLLAAKNIHELGSLFKGPTVPCESQIKIFESLKTEYLVRKEKLIYDLGEVWNDHVLWTLYDKDSELRHSQLKICMPSPEKASEIISLLKAMRYMNYLDQKMKVFSNHVLNHIFKPIVMHCAQVTLDCQVSSFSLHVTVIKDDGEKPSPSQVFVDLRTAFQFLETSFLNISVSNEEDQEDLTLMMLLGSLIGTEFSDLLIKECLAEAIPGSKEELESYNAIISQTEALQCYLREIGFFTAKQESILEYARNVDVLFASKMCQDILHRARTLMQQELHETFQLSSGDSPKVDWLSEGFARSASSGYNPKEEKASLNPTSKLSSYIFQMPTCKISLSVEKLVSMVYDVLTEASSSKSLCAVRLFYTARNILELFCDVVPVYHKENLERLPQLSGLHHNNCMYIAHHLMTLGHQFNHHFPNPLCDNFTTFVDLIPHVRNLGTEVFLAQMLLQKKQLLDIIRDIGGFHLMASDSLFMAKLEKALKQCLHQLSLLQRVWQDVLPLNVYCQAVGTLLNSVVEEIISQITNQEDIPSEATTELIAVLGILLSKGPYLFKVKNETKTSTEDVHRFVAKWMKFKELLLILGATMKDIVERWTQGKGPLAHEFTVNEIKQLIRALFQNTDRRAAVLAKIK